MVVLQRQASSVEARTLVVASAPQWLGVREQGWEGYRREKGVVSRPMLAGFGDE